MSTPGVNGEKAYGNETEYTDGQGAETPVHDGERQMSFAEKGVKPKKKENAWLARVKRGRPLPSKRRLWGMIFGIFGVMFLVGWNDASQGPLLPLLQTYYNVNYTVISIIWIMTAVGVVTAAISNVFLADWLGFGILTPLGALLQTIGYCFMFWGGPYPLFLIAYLFIGCGVGWQDAQVNSMASRMPNATTVMFLAHAVYGLGATVSPFVSTAFLQKLPETFYHYFAISLGLAFATVVMLVLVFQGRSEEGVVGDRVEGGAGTGEGKTVMPDAGGAMEGLREHEEAEARAAGGGTRNGDTPTSTMEPQDKVAAVQRSSGSKFKAIIRSPRTFCLAFYIFAYMGIEVSIGGWATTFLLEERNGDDRSGYVTSGYFGGLTVGRVILIPVTNYLGHRTSVYVYRANLANHYDSPDVNIMPSVLIISSAICLALEFVVWFVPSLIGSAVSISLIGVFMGPMYPSCVLIIMEIMPGDLHTGTIGMLACLGVVGSAIMPFVTGAIANEHGVWVLQPVMVGLWGVSLVLWTVVSRFKRVDGK